MNVNASLGVAAVSLGFASSALGVVTLALGLRQRRASLLRAGRL